MTTPGIASMSPSFVGTANGFERVKAPSKKPHGKVDCSSSVAVRCETGDCCEAVLFWQLKCEQENTQLADVSRMYIVIYYKEVTVVWVFIVEVLNIF